MYPLIPKGTTLYLTLSLRLIQFFNCPILDTEYPIHPGRVLPSDFFRHFGDFPSVNDLIVYLVWFFRTFVVYSSLDSLDLSQCSIRVYLKLGRRKLDTHPNPLYGYHIHTNTHTRGKRIHIRTPHTQVLDFLHMVVTRKPGSVTKGPTLSGILT